MLNLGIELELDFVIHADFFFFKQKTAYEMRISDWSSDVCSSDLILSSAEKWRQTRRHFSAEDEIRIVLDGLRGEDSIAELCRTQRSAERRVGPECVSPCRSRWSPSH